METKGTIVKVAGPLVVAKDLVGARMFDVVRVSEKRLIGEVIEIRGDTCYIQVYEETGGIGVGEPVFSTGAPLSVELGPGLVKSIYDGIQRPLDEIRKQSGDFMLRGIEVSGLDRKKKWEFNPSVKQGDEVSGGDIIGEVQETVLVKHRIPVPPGVSGKITKINRGSFTIDETVAELKGGDGKTARLTMTHRWPVRKPRPYRERLAPSVPLFTGQRILDAFFPIAKGGTACVPGPFGSGKTVIQHQLAKWADAEIVVYVGCGERGNEMADVLLEFPELKDPKSGESLMERTVLVANTSNMPVAAREASVYTGITIAEYFRDMGYSVALMGDSTSRWAEALREISGRLEEMPGEEGYPAYMAKKIAEFYERAGRVICAGSPGSGSREGALSVVGAISPPGGDLSDPVVQGTLKVVKVFWSLEAWLAHARHFPAINWLTSYSQYHDELEDSYRKNLGEDWTELRVEAMTLLQKESELNEIVRLVGLDALSDQDKLILDATKSIREDFLYQSAFDPVDTYASARKQYLMLKLVMTYYRCGTEALERGVEIDRIKKIPMREDISRARFLEEGRISELEELGGKVAGTINAL